MICEHDALRYFKHFQTLLRKNLIILFITIMTISNVTSIHPVVTHVSYANNSKRAYICVVRAIVVVILILYHDTVRWWAKGMPLNNYGKMKTRNT